MLPNLFQSQVICIFVLKSNAEFQYNTIETIGAARIVLIDVYKYFDYLLYRGLL